MITYSSSFFLFSPKYFFPLERRDCGGGGVELANDDDDQWTCFWTTSIYQEG